MIIRLVILVVGITAINRFAMSTAEETLSHATKGTRLCTFIVQSFVLLHKKVILKRFTHLCDDFLSYAVGISVFKIQHLNEKCKVNKSWGY